MILTASQRTYAAPPLPGEPAPVFIQRTPTNPRCAFDTVAGRYLMLCFSERLRTPRPKRPLRRLMRVRTSSMTRKPASLVSVSTRVMTGNLDDGRPG